MAPIVNHYDYIILDCPASIEDSVINAIYFSKKFLIPIEIGGFASSAIQDVLELIAVKEYSSLTGSDTQAFRVLLMLSKHSNITIIKKALSETM